MGRILISPKERKMNMILNETPIRTAKNFGINNIEIKDLEITKKIEKFEKMTLGGDVEDFKISQDTEKTPLTYGVSKELEKQIYVNANQNIKIVANSAKHKKIYLEFKLDKENENLVENIELIAERNSESTIFIKYDSNLENDNYYHNGLLRATAMENSKMNIVVVNMLNNKSENFFNIESTVYKNASVNYYIVDFGGAHTISNYYINLAEENAEGNLNTIYLGCGNQLIDMNYIIELKGKESKGNIEVQGALKDEAKKNFKGTINLKKGGTKAKGSENEFCMLLSDKARSRALPILLCTEDDVEGAHSSAAGKVEPDMLFYIMSRGFSYKEAMKLIVKAKFNDIIEQINDDNLQQEILEEIDKRLD